MPPPVVYASYSILTCHERLLTTSNRLPFPIPDSILLLLHLHLLQCTLPEAQDPNLFNPNSYGIGERIKNMERIVYFLMSVIENDKIKAVSEHKKCLSVAGSDGLIDTPHVSNQATV